MGQGITTETQRESLQQTQREMRALIQRESCNYQMQHLKIHNPSL